MDTVAASNVEAAEAWSGPLFDRFLRFRPIVTDGLGAHGEAAIAAYPPQPGDRVLDVGCGFGDTTQRLAGLVGDGEAVGVDVAEPFIELAKREAAEAGANNQLPRRRRAGGRAGRALRLRLLADGDHVLR